MGSPRPVVEDQPAFTELYDELRRIAAAYLRRERSGHTLQPTALVHEAYLRLSALSRIHWQNRAQVLGIAAEMMRNILVSHARRRSTLKRAQPAVSIELPMAVNGAEASLCDALAVNAALSRLEETHGAAAKVMELRFFGGLTEEECAEYMGISRTSAQRYYAYGRAWLLRELSTAI